MKIQCSFWHYFKVFLTALTTHRAHHIISNILGYMHYSVVQRILLIFYVFLSFLDYNVCRERELFPFQLQLINKQKIFIQQ